MSFAVNRFSGFSAQPLTSAMNDVVAGLTASLETEDSGAIQRSADVFQAFDPGLSGIQSSSGSVAEVGDFATPTSYQLAGTSTEWDQVVTNLNTRSFDIGRSLNTFVRGFKNAKLEGAIDDSQALALGKMNSRVTDFVDLYRQLGAAIGSFMWMGSMSD